MEIKQGYNEQEECREIKVFIDDFEDVSALKKLIKLYVNDIGSHYDSYCLLTVETKNGFRLEVDGQSEKNDDSLEIYFHSRTFFREEDHLSFNLDLSNSSYDKMADLIFDHFMLTINHYKIKKFEKVGNEVL